MSRFGWLLRRISRMYWREVPYRLAMVCRVYLQSRGFLLAPQTAREAADARWGKGWCRVPQAVPDAASLFAAADRVLDGQLEVFGCGVPMHDGAPAWNADPVTGTPIDRRFGLLIDFRHLGAGIDVKHLWEVNRHLWWVPLAQCYAASGRTVYLDKLRSLLSGWLDECPYPMGANWSSPVEHGVRLVNWSIVWHLIGAEKSEMFADASGRKLLARWLDSIRQHIVFASDNYSRYSSANNHLVGEAAGVFVAAHTWDRWTETRALRAGAKAILETEALRQFAADGVNLEQATGYHKFCLQFLLAAGLTGRANGDDFSAAYWERIDAAMTFLAAVMDCRGNVPGIGDSDDSEVWRLDSDESPAGGFRALLALGASLFSRDDLRDKARRIGCGVEDLTAWVSPDLATSTVRKTEALPTRFPRGGYAVLGSRLHEPGELRALFDCGPLGFNRIAGHGHADALSVLVDWDGESFLVDSGTYCYNAEPDLRHYFRGTSAHNTVVVDGVDQSEYGGSFLWLRDVDCRVVEDLRERVHAWHDGYGRLADPVRHHRRITCLPDGTGFDVEDWLESTHAHDVALHWHAAAGVDVRRRGDGDWVLARASRTLMLRIEPMGNADAVRTVVTPTRGWVSSRFYERQDSVVLVARANLPPGCVIRTRILTRPPDAV